MNDASGRRSTCFTRAMAFAAAVLLSACGGDDGGSSETGLSAARGTYLPVAWPIWNASGAIEGYRLSLIDPRTPGKRIVVSADPVSSPIATLSRGTFDTSRQAFDDLRSTALVFLDKSRLYRLDLAVQDTPHTPTADESGAGVCQIAFHATDLVEPAATWFLARVAGSDGQCGTGDDRHVWVSASDRADTPPRPHSSGVAPIGSWIDPETGRPGGFLLVEQGRLVAVSPVSPEAPRTAVTVLDGIDNALAFGAGGRQGLLLSAVGTDGAGFVQWIDPAVRPVAVGRRAVFPGAPWPASPIWNADAVYTFVDTAGSGEIWRVPLGAGSVPRRLATLRGSVSGLGDDQATLYASVGLPPEAGSQERSFEIVKIDKESGAVQSIEPPSTQPSFVVATEADTVVIHTPGRGARILRGGVDLGEQADRVVLGFPESTSLRLDRPQSSRRGVVLGWSRAGEAAIDPTRSIAYRDSRTGLETDLGRLAPAPRYGASRAVFNAGFGPQAFAFAGDGLDDLDLYWFDVSRPGSLTAVGR